MGVVRSIEYYTQTVARDLPNRRQLQKLKKLHC